MSPNPGLWNPLLFFEAVLPAVVQSTRCVCGRDGFVFISGGITLSMLETLWAISCGAKRRGREREESTYFAANILRGFCSFSDFHMSVYSCLRSSTWMPGFDLRTNCPINSWMSEFNLHLSPLTFTLAFPFIIGDFLTAKFNKIRVTESELDCEHRWRWGGMVCDAALCRAGNSC